MIINVVTVKHAILLSFPLLMLWAFYSEVVISYSQHLEKKHDMLLGMLFDRGTYEKLYSYRHLINGFAVHLSPEQVKPEGLQHLFFSQCSFCYQV